MSRRLVTNLSPEAKLTGKLFYTDLIIWAIGIALSFLTHSFFPNIIIKIFYIMTVMGMAIWFSIQPKRNPKKRNYQVLQFAWKRDRETYHMIMPSELAYFETEQMEMEVDEDFIDLTTL